MCLYFSSYVDSYRGISVQLGGEETDLKTTMDKQGFTLNQQQERHAGEAGC